ncbi:MAG: hypothetical protein JST30_05595 [Armatimonadetes bacterium]|nr:hypothetical protein [Armatimonadota bacterium]
MRSLTVPLAELGLIAVTRGLLGAGLGFLTADRIATGRRRNMGKALVVIGVLSTVPLLIDLFHKLKSENEGRSSVWEKS